MKSFLRVSPRMVFRPLMKSDLVAMYKLSSIPEVEQYNTLGIPKDISVTKAILKERLRENKAESIGNLTLTVEQKGTNTFMGLFGISLGRPTQQKAEIWYKFHPDFWGKGLATEAVNCMLDYCFEELNLHRVEAGCAVENIASIRVLEKVGMLREGRARQSLALPSGWSDSYEYGLLKTDPRG